VSELERLKSLLLTPEREQMHALDRRADALKEDFDALPSVLPELLEQAQRVSAPGRLGRALAEPVADALGEAVNRRRETIVDALFPVIMPAIRRAIAEALRVLSADINRLLESSFTPRGIGWRIQSLRTGVPYAQIALKHSFHYRVDYLLLIQRETGLVLDRESAADLPALDSDAISGMLTAIGDFVRDSVASEGGDSLSSATVGEHVLWVIEGPEAKLAAFIRGVPPESLKTELQARLEALHQQLGNDLTLPPEKIAGLVEIKNALTPDDLRSSQEAAAPKAGSMRVLWIAAAALTILLGLYFFVSWRWQQRVDAVEAMLRGWPGFHLTDIDSNLWRRVRVRGLLDPLADSPVNRLRTIDFPDADVQMNLRGYISADPEIVRKRLRPLLGLPEHVEFDLDGGRAILRGLASIDVFENLHPERAVLVGVGQLDISQLRLDLAASVRESIGLPEGVEIQSRAAGWAVSGACEQSWHAQLQALLMKHPGFGAVDVTGLVAKEAQRLSEINQALRSIPVQFVSGITLDVGAAAKIEQIAELIKQALLLSNSLGKTLVIDAFGLNDPTGTEEQNAALRDRRALLLQQELRKRLGFDPKFASDAESAPLVATIRSRAALAQLRFE
jgi:hypothetical protein